MGTTEINNSPVGESALPDAVTRLSIPAGNPRRVMIRSATHSDVHWILNDLEDFAAFYGTKHSLFPDRETGEAIVATMIEKHLVIVAVSVLEEPCGFIAGFVTQHVYNPKITVLAEAFWWVRQSWRGSRAGAALLSAFTEWGHSHANWITFTLEHNSPVNEATLLKRGYRLQERTYLMEIN